MIGISTGWVTVGADVGAGRTVERLGLSGLDVEGIRRYVMTGERSN